MYIFYFAAVCTDVICCVFIHSRNTRNVKFDCGIISLEERLMEMVGHDKLHNLML